MRDRRRLAAALLLVTIGCNRQDAETLGRIGSQLKKRAADVAPVQAGKDKLTVALPGFEPKAGKAP